MMKFKVSEQEKKEILRQIEIQIHSFPERWNISKAENELNILKNENNLTQTLLRMFDNDVSIELSPEMLEQVREDSYLDNDYFEKIINENGYISWHWLKRIYNGYEILKKRTIILDQEIRDILLLMDKVIPVPGDEKDREIINKMEEDLKNGKIRYKDFEYLIAMIPETKGHNNYELVDLYNEGEISEDELLYKLGTKEVNVPILEFKQTYEIKKRNILIESIKDIWESQIKLETIEEKLPEDLKMQIDNLLLNINKSNLDELETETLEKFVNEYNEISNVAWNRYIDGKNNFLVHVTEHHIKGEFRDPVISTSLISLPDTIKTYGNLPYGYQIKPKRIKRANARDIMTFNGRRDDYAAAGTYLSIIVKLPQIVKNEIMNNDEISEIVLDDFEFESVVYLGARIPPKYEYNVIKEHSKARGNIPINIIGEEGLVPLEEAIYRETKRQQEILENTEKEKAIKLQEESSTQMVEENNKLKQQEEKNKNVNIITDTGNIINEHCKDLSKNNFQVMELYSKLGLKNNLTDYTSIYEMTNSLIQSIQKINFDELDDQKIQDIAKTFSDKTTIESIFSEFKDTQRTKYIEALGDKVQHLITKAKKDNLRQEYMKIRNEKIGFIQKLFGKGKLREEYLRNIELRMKLITPDEKKYNSTTEVFEDLYNYVIQNTSTKEILEFVDKYQKYSEPNQKEERMIESIQEQEAIPKPLGLIPLNKVSFKDIKTRLAEVININHIVSENVRDVLAKKSRPCWQYTPDNSIQKFKQFVEKSKRTLGIEEEKSNKLERMQE